MPQTGPMAAKPELASPTLSHDDRPSPQHLSEAARIFSMLAEPTRLELLHLLTKGPADVGTLDATMAASRTAISQHLAKLRLAGIVDTRREGRHIIYSLRGGHVERLVREGLNHADHVITGEAPHS